MAYQNGGSAVTEPIFSNQPSGQNTTPQPNGGSAGGGLFGSLRESVGKLFSGGSTNGGVWAQGSTATDPSFSPGTQAPVHCSFVPRVAMQCPPDYHVADPVLEAMTEGTDAGVLVRLTSGWNPNARTFSRTRRSAQLSGDLEIGWAHAATVGKSWMGRDVIRELARQLPELSAQAWGADFANRLKTDAFSNEIIDLFLKRSSLPEDPRGKQLIQGWSAISQTAPGQRVYASEWFRSKVRPMIQEMETRGWKQKRTLAALVRLRNSGRQSMITSRTSLGEAAAVDAGLKDYVAEKSSRANDAERIRSWPELNGEIKQWPQWQDLKFQGATTVASPPQEVVSPTPQPTPQPAPTPTTTTPTAPHTQESRGGPLVPGVDASGRIREESGAGTFILGALATLLLGATVVMATKIAK